VHVVDLADAHVKAFRVSRGRRRDHRAEPGTGLGSSVYEVLAAAERVIERSVSRADGPVVLGIPTHPDGCVD